MAVNQIEISTDWIDRVKELMAKHGLSHCTDLALKSGLSAGSLNQAMRGMHMPRQSTIDKIAEALDTTPQYLIYGDTMKAVHEVPILDTAEQIRQWVSGQDLNTRDVKFAEPQGSIRLKLNSFALVYRHRDLEPECKHDDTLFFEPLDDDSDLNHDTMIMVIRDDTHLMIGKYVSSNHGDFLESVNSKYQPIHITGTDIIIAEAIQLIRNMRD